MPQADSFVRGRSPARQAFASTISAQRSHWPPRAMARASGACLSGWTVRRAFSSASRARSDTDAGARDQIVI
jgi:hypothetical protein